MFQYQKFVVNLPMKMEQPVWQNLRHQCKNFRFLFDFLKPEWIDLISPSSIQTTWKLSWWSSAYDEPMWSKLDILLKLAFFLLILKISVFHLTSFWQANFFNWTYLLSRTSPCQEIISMYTRTYSLQMYHKVQLLINRL